MFGHVLRSNSNSPALLSLKFAVTNTYKNRLGRHQTNLFNVLKSDLSDRNLDLCSFDDLKNVCHVATDRRRWKNLF